MQSAVQTCNCTPGVYEVSEHPCEGLGLACFYKIMDRVGNFNSIEDDLTGENQTCLSSCSQQHYSVETSSSAFPITNALWPA